MADYSAATLREMLDAAGITAAELAERAGIHRVTMSNFLRGLPPSAETWGRIEKALAGALDDRVKTASKARRKLAA